jgi:hypothetical protein
MHPRNPAKLTVFDVLGADIFTSNINNTNMLPKTLFEPEGGTGWIDCSNSWNSSTLYSLVRSEESMSMSANGNKELVHRSFNERLNNTSYRRYRNG